MGSRVKSQTQYFGSWILKDVSQGFRSRGSGCLNGSIQNKSLHLKSSSKKEKEGTRINQYVEKDIYYCLSLKK